MPSHTYSQMNISTQAVCDSANDENGFTLMKELRTLEKRVKSLFLLSIKYFSICDVLLSYLIGIGNIVNFAFHLFFLMLIEFGLRLRHLCLLLNEHLEHSKSCFSSVHLDVDEFGLRSLHPDRTLRHTAQGSSKARYS